MTKSDLIDVLCETQKIPKGRAEILVQVIFESMEEALKRGERIEIRGFGSFELRSYKPYEGRNPRTGVRVSVQPKRLPFFKVGKELKERVNAGRSTAVTGWPDGQARAAKPDGKPAPDGTPVAAPANGTGPVADGHTPAASASGQEAPALPNASRASV
jgi:integration host factor subunit beta